MPLVPVAVNARRAAAALLCTGCLACATRSARLAHPPGSAAAPDAEPAPRRPVATMLREDPPLPGDGAAAWELWPGLEREAAPAGDEPPADEPARDHGGHPHGH